MIDAHCHLEQKDYDPDREEVIKRCKELLKAVVFSCAHPRDFETALEIAEKHRGFVFLTAGIHPEYIKEISEDEIHSFFGLLRKNRKKLVGLGECGLDYHWVQEEDWREKQKKLFRRHISFAKDLGLPLVIHSREAEGDCLDLLEKEGAKNVLMHFFSDKDLAERAIEDGYFISVNTLVLKSKSIRKILKKTPLERLMTETDAPWLGFGKRNEPIAVKEVIEKISELERIPFEEIDKATTNNARRFFGLKDI
ncbi:MAG: TatD family hydrolase [Candidatus Aenigmarchaeota archaeon]|nr:TatD family hydrolase [Candidatus Aenigmarchaeota archaeon]